mmetsp:Transcript_42753/g.118332  ORF Transcript_42753/g.118332 Transcript_42753/m.118332 type:complete len:205 (-) Transcript_42753:165-779(-)
MDRDPVRLLLLGVQPPEGVDRVEALPCVVATSEGAYPSDRVQEVARVTERTPHQPAVAEECLKHRRLLYEDIVAVQRPFALSTMRAAEVAEALQRLLGCLSRALRRICRLQPHATLHLHIDHHDIASFLEVASRALPQQTHEALQLRDVAERALLAIPPCGHQDHRLRRQPQARLDEVECLIGEAPHVEAGAVGIRQLRHTLLA